MSKCALNTVEHSRRQIPGKDGCFLQCRWGLEFCDGVEQSIDLGFLIQWFIFVAEVSKTLAPMVYLCCRSNQDLGFCLLPTCKGSGPSIALPQTRFIIKVCRSKPGFLGREFYPTHWCCCLSVEVNCDAKSWDRELLSISCRQQHAHSNNSCLQLSSGSPEPFNPRVVPFGF